MLRARRQFTAERLGFYLTQLAFFYRLQFELRNLEMTLAESLDVIEDANFNDQDLHYHLTWTLGHLGLLNNQIRASIRAIELRIHRLILVTEPNPAV